MSTQFRGQRAGGTDISGGISDVIVVGVEGNTIVVVVGNLKDARAYLIEILEILEMEVPLHICACY